MNARQRAGRGGAEGASSSMSSSGPRIAICGAATGDPISYKQAREAGRLLAQAGAVLLCGGLGGVMQAACQGAREAGGLTVGILPGADAAAANPYVDLPIVTGMGQARNVILVLSADAVIAIAGEAGTLSEIALALKLGRPVVGLGTWRLTGSDGLPEERIRYAGTPEEAVRMALESAGREAR